MIKRAPEGKVVLNLLKLKNYVKDTVLVCATEGNPKYCSVIHFLSYLNLLYLLPRI
jgi:hypothetical protein